MPLLELVRSRQRQRRTPGDRYRYDHYKTAKTIREAWTGSVRCLPRRGLLVCQGVHRKRKVTNRGRLHCNVSSSQWKIHRELMGQTFRLDLNLAECKEAGGIGDGTCILSSWAVGSVGRLVHHNDDGDEQQRRQR